MEIIFMVFMAVVSVMALFAIMVVFRDVVRETYDSRRERDKATAEIVAMAERIVAEQSAKAEKPCACEQPAAEEKVAKVEAEDEQKPEVEEVKPCEEEVKCLCEQSVAEETVEEEPVEETAEEEVKTEEAPADEDDSVNKAFVDLGEGEAEVNEVAEEEDTEGKISFSTGQQQTLEEKYLALTSEQKSWYDEIVKYAAAVEGSKRYKNLRYEEYKVGKNRLVRMLIKRGVIHCEFILHNSDFKNYINENKISVKQSATTMLVDSAVTVGAVKNSIDIVVAAIAEEKEYKKKLAREKRKAARAAANAEASAEE